MRWKVVPETVAVRELPMILIVLTRPPQAPAPSRLVICRRDQVSRVISVPFSAET
jgi:hypothetical protein